VNPLAWPLNGECQRERARARSLAADDDVAFNQIQSFVKYRLTTCAVLITIFSPANDGLTATPKDYQMSKSNLFQIFQRADGIQYACKDGKAVYYRPHRSAEWLKTSAVPDFQYFDLVAENAQLDNWPGTLVKSSITLAEITAIYEQHEAIISDKDLAASLRQCNEQADVIYRKYGDGEPLPPRTAIEWAHWFASGLAHEQNCDGLAADQFQRDAYGND
jgi:hypothetical protein